MKNTLIKYKIEATRLITGYALDAIPCEQGEWIKAIDFDEYKIQVEADYRNMLELRAHLMEAVDCKIPQGNCSTHCQYCIFGDGKL